MKDKNHGLVEDSRGEDNIATEDENQEDELEKVGLTSDDFSEDPGEKLNLLEHSCDDNEATSTKSDAPWHRINRDYVASKGFFFFFFAGNGTLIPYLVLYFKQLRLSPAQVGLVSGMKPYISFALIPFWGYIADKTRKAKWIYVLAMIAYVSGYLAYSFAPSRHVCLLKSNSTMHRLEPMPHGHHRRSTHSEVSMAVLYIGNTSIIGEPHKMMPYKSRRDDVPWPLSVVSGREVQDVSSFSQNYDDVHVDINGIFTYLLFITIIATIFSCPALTLVDTATVCMLRSRGETYKYGKQRLWGAIGWGLTAFSVGALVSQIPLCPGRNHEVNYYPSFYIFTGLMLMALVIGTRLDFDETHRSDHHADRMHAFAVGLKLLCNPSYFLFMITSFYVGVAMSVIRTFLFWHLKDIGGTQLLFSIVSAINCSSEVLMYYFSATFIKKIGHIHVLYLGLFCYALRLFYYAFLPNPWYVLPVEPLSGITTAAVWASMTSYVGLNSAAGSATTLQGILHGVHWGLGHGCGELIGGFMVGAFGARKTFAVFGVLSLINLILYALTTKLCEIFGSKKNETRTEGEQDYVAVKQCCN